MRSAPFLNAHPPPIQTLPALPIPLAPPSPSTAEPIIDLRPALGWTTLLPARLLTVCLWGVGLYLAAVPLGRMPAGLRTAAALAGLGGVPLAGLLVRRSGSAKTGARSSAFGPAAGLGDARSLSRDPLRQELAASVGIDEASLFRGRHARICTVHHNGVGDLVAIQASQPMMESQLPSRDAHPVG